jgi:hypothetical protein
VGRYLVPGSPLELNVPQTALSREVREAIARVQLGESVVLVPDAGGEAEGGDSDAAAASGAAANSDLFAMVRRHVEYTLRQDALLRFDGKRT